MEKRPLIGIPADRRVLGPQPYHLVGEKYLTAILDAAGALPVIVPAIGRELALDDLLATVDGLLFTGSPSNVEPHRYRGEPSRQGTLHDPERDATTLPLIPQGGGGGRAGAGDLPRLPGDERRLRRHAATSSCTRCPGTWTTARIRTSRSRCSTGRRTR